VVIGIPQKKAMNVDLPNSGLGGKWAECIDKEPLRERKERSCWSRKPKCVLSLAEVLGGAETIR